MTTLSLRIPRDVAHKLARWANMGQTKDKSAAARELMEYGWTFVLMEEYRKGRLSLGKLSQELGFSISETMDLLTEHGIQGHLDYEDYLKGLERLRKVF